MSLCPVPASFPVFQPSPLKRFDLCMQKGLQVQMKKAWPTMLPPSKYVQS